jgi:hypothetical protein
VRCNPALLSASDVMLCTSADVIGMLRRSWGLSRPRLSDRRRRSRAAGRSLSGFAYCHRPCKASKLPPPDQFPLRGHTNETVKTTLKTRHHNRSRKTLAHCCSGNSGRLLFGVRPEFEAFYILAATNDWLMFRGPNGTGVADGPLPTQFGANKNLAWKAAVPFGRSSPVVTADRVFLTASEGDKTRHSRP